MKNFFFSHSVLNVCIICVQKFFSVLTVSCCLIMVFATVPCGAVRSQNQPQGNTARVQLIAFNDFHGNLLPPQGQTGNIPWRNQQGIIKYVPAGGAAQLAYDMRAIRQGKKYSLVVASGDLIGASPLVSSMFNDKPAINVLNSLGLDTSSVGNHEFDKGIDNLLHMQRGDCFFQGMCTHSTTFDGAHFQYLAANVTQRGFHPLPPYWIWRKDGINIGFIGLPLQGVRAVSTIQGTQGLDFAPEVPVINHYAQELHQQGINSIFLLLHQGSMSQIAAANDPCEHPDQQLSGSIQSIAQQVSPYVDAIISAHSHQAYICAIPDPHHQLRLVTQAASFGRLFTEYSFNYDLHTGKIDRSSMVARQHLVRADDPQASDIAQQVAYWTAKSAPIAHQIVGYAQHNISAHADNMYQSPLGVLVALSQNEAMKPYGSQIAFTNPGGVRSDLIVHNHIITYESAYATQPFRNTLYTEELTGKQIKQILEQQFISHQGKGSTVLQASPELTYTVIRHHLSGHREVLASSVRINNRLVEDDEKYRVTINDFLAQGGDGFDEFTHTSTKIAGIIDDEAFINYMKKHSSPRHFLTIPTGGGVHEITE